MNLLEGVSLSELILMILGVVVGLALIGIFIYTAVKKDPNLNLIYAFVIPILMIGYPSIKKIQFDKGVITVDKISSVVEKNPLDTAAHRTLHDAIEALPAGTAKESPSASTSIAKAQVALGQYDSAQVYVQRASELDPTNENIKEIANMIRMKQMDKRRFEDNVGHLDKRVSNWEANRHDRNERDSISLLLKTIDSNHNENDPLKVDAKPLLTIAKALAIDGHKQQAIDMLDNVLKITPNQPEATDLKNKIINNYFEAPAIAASVGTPVRPQKSAKRNAPNPTPKPATALQLPVHPSDTLGLRMKIVPRAVFEVKNVN